MQQLLKHLMTIPEAASLAAAVENGGCPAAVTAAAAAGQQGHAESTRQCKRQEASLFHSGILL